MAIVDLLCCSVVFIAGLIAAVVVPACEYLNFTGGLLLEVIGVETWTHNTTIICLLVLLHLAVLYAVTRSTTNTLQKLFSRLTFISVSYLWLLTFLSFPVFENAIYSQVGLLSIAFQAAILGIKCVIGEHND